MAIQIIPNFRKPHPGIIQEPDKRLRAVSKPIIKIDNSTKEIAEKLIKLLKEIDRPFKPWLGMAAPQIGISKRVIAIKESYLKYFILINPEIIQQSWVAPTIVGCFSLPGLYLRRTPYWIKLKHQDLNGNYQQKIFKGGQAVLVQQEIDHLNGVLACD